MQSKKRVFVISSIFVFALLTGCGMGENTTVGSNGGTPEKRTEEEVSAKFQTFIETKEENHAVNIKYKVKNISGESQRLTFSSGLEADYIVYDQTGKKVKQYSDEVLATQVMKELTLSKGEGIEEGFTIADLPNGRYVIEIFLTANKNDTKAVKDLLVENSLFFFGSGQLNGQMDPHTVEVNMDGEPRAFQLTEEAQQQLPSIKDGDHISFVYKETEYGQQVIIRFIIESN